MYVHIGVSVQDIDYFFEQYEKEVEGYDALIEKLQSLGDGAKAKTVTNTLADCEAKAARIKEIKKSMGLELKLVKNKQERAEYDAAIKEIDERVAILNKDLKLAKAQHDKNDLFQDKKGMRNQFSSEGKNNEELLEGANQIQDLTFDSLARTRGLIEASKEVGTATIEELRRQKGQIEDIENEVDIIDSNLKRAERLLFNFSRRMATDRIIQVRLPAYPRVGPWHTPTRMTLARLRSPLASGLHHPQYRRHARPRAVHRHLRQEPHGVHQQQLQQRPAPLRIPHQPADKVPPGHDAPAHNLHPAHRQTVVPRETNVQTHADAAAGDRGGPHVDAR